MGAFVHFSSILVPVLPQYPQNPARPGFGGRETGLLFEVMSGSCHAISFFFNDPAVVAAASVPLGRPDRGPYQDYASSVAETDGIGSPPR